MTETTAGGYKVRCSVVVLRQHAVPLVHRTRHALDGPAGPRVRARAVQRVSLR